MPVSLLKITYSILVILYTTIGSFPHNDKICDLSLVVDALGNISYKLR